jgi:hypothetical protein
MKKTKRRKQLDKLMFKGPIDMNDETKKSTTISCYMRHTLPDEKKFIPYLIDHGKEQVDLESYIICFERLKVDLYRNLKMREVKITNNELANILGDYFLLILERCCKNA